ncbi:aldolase/citrate lyase family protein [Paracoccaceae bacterium]|nr:aldolase/citrate lyase family protein [Paracoccaceae bacterium]
MTVRMIRPRRSFIFIPGLKPDMFSKALASVADIVCVELEDGIASKDKVEARKHALVLGFSGKGSVQPKQKSLGHGALLANLKKQIPVLWSSTAS